MDVDTGQQVDVTEQRKFFAGSNPFDFIHTAPMEVQTLENVKNELIGEITRLKTENENQQRAIEQQTNNFNSLKAENENFKGEVEKAADQNGRIETLEENLAMLEMDIFGVLYPIYCRNYFTYNYIMDARGVNAHERDFFFGNTLFKAVDGLAPKTKTINNTHGKPYNRRWSDRLNNSIKNDCALAVLIYQWMINPDLSQQYNIPPAKEQVAEIANRYFNSIGGVIANVTLPLSMALAMYRYRHHNPQETFNVALDFYPTLDYYEYTFFSYYNVIDKMPKGFTENIPHIFNYQWLK
jgi:hypothetical protein